MSPSKNYVWKICVAGDGSVGKTSIILQYCEKKFQENYIMTIGSNFAIKSIDLPEYDASVKLQIWDLAGQQHFSFVRPPFYKGASGIIYVYDVTRRESFENIENWRVEVENAISVKPSVLVGNKIDLSDERVVSKKEGEDLASKINGCVGFFETSAKTGANLDDVFLKLINSILEKK
ncbi:MAG: Rab family GTPase [Promethearchaeota archaeon]